MSLIIDVGVNGEGGSDFNYIVKMGLIMVGLSCAAMICGALGVRASSIASAGFVKNLRTSMFEKIQNYSFSNIEKFDVPSLVTRMTKDMRELRTAYASVVRGGFRAPLNLIFSTIMVYSINKELSVIFFIAIPVLGIGLYLIAHTAQPLFRVLMKRFDELNADLEENFVAIRVVKTFVREQYEKVKFNKTSDNVRKFQAHAESITILNDPFFNLVMYACMIAVSWFGGKQIIAGTMLTGEFMSFISYLIQILYALTMLT